MLRKITASIAALNYTLMFVKSLLYFPSELMSIGKNEVERIEIFQKTLNHSTVVLLDRISNLIWPITTIAMLLFLLSFLFEKKSVLIANNQVGSLNEGQGILNPNDQPSTGLNIISFLIPLVGLIIYLTEREKSPIKATSAGKAALWGVGVTIVLSIISFFVMFSIINSIN
jgi:hypothetical protein